MLGVLHMSSRAIILAASGGCLLFLSPIGCRAQYLQNFVVAILVAGFKYQYSVERRPRDADYKSCIKLGGLPLNELIQFLELVRRQFYASPVSLGCC